MSKIFNCTLVGLNSSTIHQFNGNWKSIYNNLKGMTFNHANITYNCDIIKSNIIIEGNKSVVLSMIEFMYHSSL
jgi:hypothetical protein